MHSWCKQFIFPVKPKYTPCERILAAEANILLVTRDMPKVVVRPQMTGCLEVLWLWALRFPWEEFIRDKIPYFLYISFLQCTLRCSFPILKSIRWVLKDIVYCKNLQFSRGCEFKLHTKPDFNSHLYSSCVNVPIDNIPMQTFKLGKLFNPCYKSGYVYITYTNIPATYHVLVCTHLANLSKLALYLLYNCSLTQHFSLFKN